MKILILASTLALLPLAARSGDSVPPSPTASWTCTAVGYDASYEPNFFDGPLMPTLEEAKAEALQLCLGKQCRIHACYSY